MKLKSVLVLSLLSGMLLTGCSNSDNKSSGSTFDKAMSEGKLAIASQEYEKAEGMFDLAIQENKDDKEAKSLYEQTSKIIKAKKLIEEGNLEEAKVTLQELKNIDSNLDSLKKEADKLLEEINSKINDKDSKKEVEVPESNSNEKAKKSDKGEDRKEVKQDKYLSEFNNIVQNKDIKNLNKDYIDQQIDQGPELDQSYLKTAADKCSELKDKFYNLFEIAPEELQYNVDKVYVYLVHAENSFLDAYNSQSIEDVYSNLDLAYGALDGFKGFLNDLQNDTDRYYNQ